MEIQQHSIGLFILAGSLLILLASATGIGAWKTHYITWNIGDDIGQHFTLSLNAIASVVGADKFSNNVLLQQGFTLGFSLVCLGGVYFWIKQLITSVGKLAGAPANNRNSSPRENSDFATYAIAACFISTGVCFYFIENGLSINLWLFAGTLVWYLVVSIAIENSLSSAHTEITAKIYSSFTLGIILIGGIQTCYLIINNTLNAEYGYTTAYTLVFLIAGWNWYANFRELINKISTPNESNTLFDTQE